MNKVLGYIQEIVIILTLSVILSPVLQAIIKINREITEPLPLLLRWSCRFLLLIAILAWRLPNLINIAKDE